RSGATGSIGRWAIRAGPGSPRRKAGPAPPPHPCPPPRGRPGPTYPSPAPPRPLPPLAPSAETDVTVELTPLRRGHVRFTGLTLARPDPLGLVHALKTIRLPQSLLVLPRRYPVAH